MQENAEVLSREEVIAAVKESKEWEIDVEYGVQIGLTHDRSVRTSFGNLFGDHALTPVADYAENYQPILTALRAVRDEVQSGRVFGSPDRCCICGRTTPDAAVGSSRYWTGGEGGHPVFYCRTGDSPECDRAVHKVWHGTAEVKGFWPNSNGEAAIAILRARRFLAETAQAKIEASNQQHVLPVQPPIPVDPYIAQREREAHPDFEEKMRQANMAYLSSQAHIDIAHIGWQDTMRAQREAVQAEQRRRVLLGRERGPEAKLVLMSDVIRK